MLYETHWKQIVYGSRKKYSYRLSQMHLHLMTRWTVHLWCAVDFNCLKALHCWNRRHIKGTFHSDSRYPPGRPTQVSESAKKCEKRYMIFMKNWNKVLSEMVFSHSRVWVCYNARCKKQNKTKQKTFLHVALAKCKKQQQQKKKKKKYIYIQRNSFLHFVKWSISTQNDIVM